MQQKKRGAGGLVGFHTPFLLPLIHCDNKDHFVHYSSDAPLIFLLFLFQSRGFECRPEQERAYGMQQCAISKSPTGNQTDGMHHYWKLMEQQLRFCLYMQTSRLLVQIVSGFVSGIVCVCVWVCVSLCEQNAFIIQGNKIDCGEEQKRAQALITSKKSKNIKSWIILEKATSCSCLSLTMHQPDGNFLSIMELNFQNVLPDFLIFIVELASTVSFCSELYQQPRPCITHAPTVW